MTFPLASDQYTATNSAISTAQLEVEQQLLAKYGDLFTQISYATTQQQYSTTYTVPNLTDIPALISALQRAGYTVTQNSYVLSIGWLFTSAIGTANVLPADSAGFLTNNGTGQLSYTTVSSIAITSTQVIAALGYKPKQFAIAMGAALS
jgi:hypothetical protein